jgi:uncharacterized membrane protein
MLAVIMGVAVALLGIHVFTLGTRKSVMASQATQDSHAALMGTVGVEALGIVLLIVGLGMSLRHYM